MAAVKPAGQRVVIVGGGAVARRRAEVLARHGAAVRVFDPFGDPEASWPPGVKFSRRRVGQRDLQNAWLVVVATSDPEVNAKVGAWAEEMGLEVNRADEVDAGTFAVPAVMENANGWQLAILGGDAGPLFSTWLKDLLKFSVSLPKVSQVYRSLTEARQILATRDDLTPEVRAKVMRGVMTRILETDEDIDVSNTVATLLNRQV